MSKFSDGSTSGFEELPVDAAWLNWTRGDAKLSPLMKTDPGVYLGGWRAFVTSTDRTTNEQRNNPTLPLPVVERVSEDGKHPYSVYASNTINFLPIQHRTRYELREDAVDPQTGKKFRKLVATCKERRQGYSPCRQIFGLVYSGEEHAPAILNINKWSAFITFEKAGQKWNKFKEPENMVLVRKYGTVGTKDDKGKVFPKFEVYGEGRSTPIEAIGNPQFIALTAEMDALFEGSVAWRNCPKWNAVGEVTEDPQVDTAMTKFLSTCEDMGLSNIEIEQLVKENQGDYVKALKAATGDFDIDAVNAELTDGDLPF